jgi:DNA-directed RNA polymerase subunit RPC12/RpoP
MTDYKTHQACFDCRKTFKRRLLHDVARDEQQSVAAKCPDCGEATASMGLDFKSPPKDDVKAWQHMRSLYTAGITYHSCGCSGPGYIPATTKELMAYLENRLTDYVGELRYWLNRAEPTTKAEFEYDKNKNWAHNSRLPKQGRNGGVNSAEALAYWQKRVYDLEHNLSKAKAQVMEK